MNVSNELDGFQKAMAEYYRLKDAEDRQNKMYSFRIAVYGTIEIIYPPAAFEISKKHYDDYIEHLIDIKVPVIQIGRAHV